MIHEHSYTIDDRSNADIATNSYYMYKIDIDLAKQIGVSHFYSLVTNFLDEIFRIYLLLLRNGSL